MPWPALNVRRRLGEGSVFSLRIAMTIGRGIVPSSSIELMRLLVFVSLIRTGYAQDQRRPVPGMHVTYLGTAGWEIAVNLPPGVRQTVKTQFAVQ